MVQFAQGRELHLDYGYCLDDNARAWLASILSLRLDPHDSDAKVVGEASLEFVESCRRPDGRFHNLMDENGNFTDEVGSPESFGRTVWASGIAARCAQDPEWRERAVTLLRGSLKRLDDLRDLRPNAYGILGLAAAVAPDRASPASSIGDIPDNLKRDLTEALSALCEALHAKFLAYATEDWTWWEPTLTWGNARLPEALLRGAAALGDSKLEQSGLRALDFLARVTQTGDMFVPIGNEGWYENGKPQAVYDQQPIEACATVDAWLAANKLTQRWEYRAKALEAFCWFFGLNTEKLVMVESDGGCHDGLQPGRVNANMGAESTLSYLQAHAAIALNLHEET